MHQIQVKAELVNSCHEKQWQRHQYLQLPGDLKCLLLTSPSLPSREYLLSRFSKVHGSHKKEQRGASDIGADVNI